ncbi:hypothetical protein M0805_001553 [Coniferiporia weirii]|nr:hypothetical protein M0805_001553 [Coniferiporia weirii]
MKNAIDHVLVDIKEHESETAESPPSLVDDSLLVIDPIAEKRLLRKLDLLLLPLFTLIHALNDINKSAVGNAKIAGLEQDLGMVGFDYNIALTIFYIFHMAAAVPSNFALKHFGSSWLALMEASFGIISISTAFVKNYRGLIITRVFLGLTEGGTLCALAYILSRYYRRTELVMRVGIFFGLSPPLAGAFNGLLASGLLSVGDIGTVSSWRKIFLVEGIITTGIGILGFFIFPTDPQNTRMLNEAERALAIARISADQVVSTNGRRERTTLELFGRAFSFNTCLCAICYAIINISMQGLSLFLPTVVATRKYCKYIFAPMYFNVEGCYVVGHFTTVESQLRTVPPYIVSAVWALFSAYHSFRMKQRTTPLIISVLLMVVGYAIFVGTENSHARYAACFLVVAGCSPSEPMLLAWGTDNAAPDTVRAAATSIIPGIGALGSIIAVWTYLPTDAPNYHHGNSLNVSTSSLCCVLIVIGALYIKWENAKRARGERDYRLVGKSTQEIEQLGYLHPRFRYQL